MSEQDLERNMNYLIGRIVKRILIVVIPTLLIPFGGFAVRDHFELKNKVDKETFWEVQNNLTLLVERKTRALESLVLKNTGDKEHMEQQIQEIKEAQKEIDKFLRDNYRVRGYNSPLTEY